jgi:hypothetical protein
MNFKNQKHQLAWFVLQSGHSFIFWPGLQTSSGYPGRSKRIRVLWSIRINNGCSNLYQQLPANSTSSVVIAYKSDSYHSILVKRHSILHLISIINMCRKKREIFLIDRCFNNKTFERHLTYTKYIARQNKNHYRVQNKMNLVLFRCFELNIDY